MILPSFSIPIAILILPAFQCGLLSTFDTASRQIKHWLNAEIEEIWELVPVGTRVEVRP